MHINESLWHARFYLVCHFIWRSFWTSQDYIYTPTQTNLCHYLRSMGAGVGVMLLYAGVGAFALYVLLWYPLVQFGWNYGIFWAVIAGIVGAIVAIVHIWKGGRRAAYWILDTAFDAADAMRLRREERAKARLESGRPTLVGLIFARIKAAKEGICPIVEIGTPPQSEGGQQ